MSELPLLQTFLAVYRLGSVTRAAEHLAMTQPGASGHLKSLETRLGKTLFEKQGRGLVPTAAAHDLARSVGAHLDMVEASILSAKIGRNAFSGTVHLGGPAEFLSEVICPQIGSLLSAGLRVEMHFGHSRDLVKECNDGKLDLVVSTQRIRQPSVSYAPLYKEHFVLIAGKEMGLRLKEIASTEVLLEHLEGEMAIAYAGDLPILRRFWRDIFDADLAVEPSLVVPDLRAVVNAVSRGLGYSVVPRYLCEIEGDRRELSIVETGPRQSNNQLLLGWNKYAANHPRIAFARDSLLETVGKGAAAQPTA